MGLKRCHTAPALYFLTWEIKKNKAHSQLIDIFFMGFNMINAAAPSGPGIFPWTLMHGFRTMPYLCPPDC
jgi:hypothetical protein